MNTERLVGDVAVEITGENKVLDDSDSATVSSSTATQCSIHRVPARFRKINKSAYTPEKISIGPYHHGKDKLEAMEITKLRYAGDLLLRNKGTNMLVKCIARVREIEDEARNCYSEIKKLTSDEFVDIMVIDGLFMIELFRKANVREIRDHDPILGNNMFNLASVVRDLVLLENQLPMVVLDCLFNVLDLKQEFDGVPLNTLALDLLHLLIPRGEKVDCSWFSECEGRHLLDLLGNSFHQLLPKDDKRNKGPWTSIPTVTELKRAGVRFEVGSKNGSFMDIKFKNGVMEIPPLVVQDQTETLLRNCIVAEQCSDGRDTFMTSYAFLIDSLINSAEDVEVLRNQGIITNMLGNDTKVAALFNKLCCEVTMADYYYSELCDKVNSYCKNRWPRALRKLRDSLAFVPMKQH